MLVSKEEIMEGFRVYAQIRYHNVLILGCRLRVEKLGQDPRERAARRKLEREVAKLTEKKEGLCQELALLTGQLYEPRRLH